MSDLIDRQVAVEEIEKYFGDLPIQGRFDILSIIKQLPTASPITPDQFRDKMYEIVEEHRGSTETKHIAMDEFMCETLKSLGYEGGVRIFEKQTKWYS